MKLKFGYDVSGLTAYVDEQKNDLLLTSVFGGKTAQMFEIQDGIKYKDMLNYLTTDVIFRANTGCPTFTATGETAFTQKEISVDSFIYETTHCPNDLEDYWTRKGLTSGQYYDSMAFEREWVTDQTARINKEVELMLWRGNKSTGSGNLALMNGFLQVIDADTTVVTGNTSSATGISSSNVIGLFEDMINVLPADVEGSPELQFECGWDTFKKLLSAFRAANNFFIDGSNPNPYQSGVYTFPTWGITVNAHKGLDTTNRIILWEKSNPVIGTDLMGDFENFQMWYEKKDDKILTRMKAKLGTQIKFGARCVEFSL